MIKDFPLMPLSKLIQRRKDEIIIQELETYSRITIHLNGRGISVRDKVIGRDIGTKRQFVVKAGQLVLSKIDARNGAFGVVPATCDRAIITGNFWTYDVDQELLDVKFFDFLSKTPMFIDFCIRASDGTTNRRYLQEPKFLAQKILLPPLEEQRRIVARIEELAAKVEEARGLRWEAFEEAEALFEGSVGSTFEHLNTIEQRSLKNLASKIGSGSTPRGGRGSYPSSGIPFIRSLNVRMRSFQWEGIAFIDKVTHEGMRGTQVKSNDVLLNITGASIGRVACVPSDLIEANVNQHVVIIRPVEALNPYYLMYWLSQPAIQKFINEKQKGATRQGFTKTQIETLQIPIPSLSEQHHIVDYSTIYNQK